MGKGRVGGEMEGVEGGTETQPPTALLTLCHLQFPWAVENTQTHTHIVHSSL